MTLRHPVRRALAGPADYRHNPQRLDRITGISAATAIRGYPVTVVQ